MRKIVLFLLCIIVLTFIGCSNSTVDDSSYDVTIVIEPDEYTRKNLNGYKEIESISSSKTDSSTNNIDRNSAQYIGNKNSKKYHIFDCPYAVNIKEENFIGFNTSDEAKNNGYSPCSRCNP